MPFKTSSQLKGSILSYICIIVLLLNCNSCSIMPITTNKFILNENHRDALSAVRTVYLINGFFYVQSRYPVDKLGNITFAEYNKVGFRYTTYNLDVSNLSETIKINAQELLEKAGIKVVDTNKEKHDAVCTIITELYPEVHDYVERKYHINERPHREYPINKRSYCTGAVMFGRISLEIPGLVIYQKEFSGFADVPEGISIFPDINELERSAVYSAHKNCNFSEKMNEIIRDVYDHKSTKKITIQKKQNSVSFWEKNNNTIRYLPLPYVPEMPTKYF